AFIADYFTAEEQALIARAPVCDQDFFANLLWSSKESALKALRQGLRLDTRSVFVTTPQGTTTWDHLQSQSSDLCTLRFHDSEKRHGWSSLQVLHTDGSIFNGWWNRSGRLLRTVVAAGACSPPIPIEPLKDSANKYNGIALIA